MSHLTAIEAIMLENHFKSENAMLHLLEFASQNCTEPRCKNICRQMADEHRNQISNLTRFI